MTERVGILLFVFGLGLTLSACGGDSGGMSSGFVGDYIITSWTENTESCDAEGDSVLEFRDKRMLVQVCDFVFFGVAVDAFLGAYPCADDADCNDNRCSSDHLVISSNAYEFRTGEDEGGWAESWSAAMEGFEADGECTGRHHEQTLFQNAEGKLRIEVRSYEVLPFPSVEKCEDYGGEQQCFDECTEQDSSAAMQGQPCVRFEVIELGPLSE